MKRNLVVAVLVIIIGALSVVAWFQYRLIKREAARAEMMPDEVVVVKEVTGRALETDVPDIPQEERQQYEEKIQQLEQELTEKAAVPAVEEKPQENFMGEMAKMINTPEMKEMIKSQQKMQMDMMYKDLFEYLQLDDDRLNTFKDLLLEKQMAAMDIGLAMMSGGLSMDEIEAQGEQLNQINEEIDGKIKELLNEEDYAVYEEYMDTQAERMQVQMFKQSLTGQGAESLTLDQEDALIRVMNEERKKFKYTTDYDDEQAGMNPELFTEELLDQHVKEMSELQERYIERAREVLSEQQLTAFIANMEQQFAMQKMGMEMAKSMFQGMKESE